MTGDPLRDADRHAERLGRIDLLREIAEEIAEEALDELDDDERDRVLEIADRHLREAEAGGDVDL